MTPSRMALGLAFCVTALLAGVVWLPSIARADMALNSLLGAYRVQPLLDAFVWVTAFGAKPTIVAVCLTATGLLGVGRLPGLVRPLWVAFLGSEATSWILKFVVGRTRPEFIEAASAASPSFPSGHSVSSMAVYGFLAFVLGTRLRGRRIALLAPAACAGLIGLVGFSRMYLSVHYASDVLAGFLIGGFWLVVAISLARRDPTGDPRSTRAPASD